jgi:uncharacterized protein (TIGR03437 family)
LANREPIRTIPFARRDRQIHREETLMRILVLFSIAVAAAPAAQPLSFSRTEIPVGPSCCSMVTADFNGDGKPDLVVTFSDSLDAGGRQLLVLMGNGDGTFATRNTLDLGQSFLLVAAVDVNGDKKADLIITAPFKGDSFVLLGNGDGTFQPPGMIGSGVLRVADFNGDGKPDLLCAGLVVRPGNGDGTFGNPIITPAAQNFTALNFAGATAVGDFNGDGKLDVAHTSAWHDAFGMVWVWLGNGDGTFRMLPPNDLFSNGGNSPRAPQVAVGDFNGDGKLDLALGAGDLTSLTGPTSFIGILLGNGDGTFRKGTTVSLFGVLLTTADVNGDGNADLVSESEIALGNGDGTFQSPEAFGYGQRSIGSDLSELIELRQYPPLVAADFDQDGKLDLAMPSHFTVIFGGGVGGGGYTSSGLSVLLNKGPGPPNSVTAVSAANGTHVVAPGSIASIYGTNLAQGTAAAGSLANLPASLGGISLHVRDSLGVDRQAELFFVSPTQVNFLVPDATAEGLAALNIDDGHLPFVEGLRATVIQMLAPAFFTADGTGTGAAAATAVRVLPNRTQISVPVFTCSNGRCNTVPIDLSQGPVYLSLYGTGFRHRSADPKGVPLAGCQIQNQIPFATYAGPQGLLPGLDQLNLHLPQVSGAGETDVVCNFSLDIQALFERAFSRPVKINIQ